MRPPGLCVPERDRRVQCVVDPQSLQGSQPIWSQRNRCPDLFQFGSPLVYLNIDARMVLESDGSGESCDSSSNDCDLKLWLSRHTEQWLYFDMKRGQDVATRLSVPNRNPVFVSEPTMASRKMQADDDRCNVVLIAISSLLICQLARGLSTKGPQKSFLSLRLTPLH